MADYIKTIPQEQFDMKKYRSTHDSYSHECNSVGCVIGHCIILEEESSVMNLPLSSHPHGGIDFTRWSERFTGLHRTSKEWDWCFTDDWSLFDNTPPGASKRIEYMLKYGVPSDFDVPMQADVDLYN